MADVTNFRQPQPEPLMRELLGAFLRQARRRQGRTLADVADVAGISVQYLSEVERGRKEASSEVLAAIVGALGLTLVDLTAGITAAMRGATSRHHLAAPTRATFRLAA